MLKQHWQFEYCKLHAWLAHSSRQVAGIHSMFWCSCNSDSLLSTGEKITCAMKKLQQVDDSSETNEFGWPNCLPFDLAWGLTGPWLWLCGWTGLYVRIFFGRRCWLLPFHFSGRKCWLLSLFHAPYRGWRLGLVIVPVIVYKNRGCLSNRLGSAPASSAACSSTPHL